jgi:tetratricopeptide (TPR) repeat protein
MTIDEFEGTIRNLKEHSASAILAIREGEKTFEIESGNEIDAVGFLEGTVDWFYAASDHEFIQGIFRQLDQPEFYYAAGMLRASFETMANRLDAAIDFYGRVQTLAPDSHEPSLRRAQLLVERRRIDEAISDYRTAARLGKGHEDELAIQLQMVEQLTKRKLFPEAAKAYDRIIELRPSLMEDRAFAKQVGKARQKAGTA